MWILSRDKNENVHVCNAFLSLEHLGMFFIYKLWQYFRWARLALRYLVWYLCLTDTKVTLLRELCGHIKRHSEHLHEEYPKCPDRAHKIKTIYPLCSSYHDPTFFFFCIIPKVTQIAFVLRTSEQLVGDTPMWFQSGAFSVEPMHVQICLIPSRRWREFLIWFVARYTAPR